MRAFFAAMLAIAICGCAAFHEPLYKSAEDEQAECLQSSLCRFMFGDHPAWTERYHSDRRNCVDHAKEIAEQARADGRRVVFAVGDMGRDRHMVVVVEGDDGTQWAFDNGRISSEPFNPKELKHWMGKIGWYTNADDAI